MNTVDKIIGSHNRNRISFFYCNFKSAEIDFSERTFGYAGVNTHAVIFLIIACKMLDCYATSFGFT